MCSLLMSLGGPLGMGAIADRWSDWSARRRRCGSVFGREAARSPPRGPDGRLMAGRPVPLEAIPRLVDRSDDAAKYGHHFAVHRRRYFNKMESDIDRALVCARLGAVVCVGGCDVG